MQFTDNRFQFILVITIPTKGINHIPMKIIRNGYFLIFLVLLGFSSCNRIDNDLMPDPDQLPIRVENDDVYTIPGQPVLIDLLSNDIILQDAVFEIIQQPTQGTATITESGRCIYVPNAGSTNGTDIIRYRVSTDNEFSDGTVRILLRTNQSDIPCEFLNLQSDFYEISDVSELDQTIFMNVLANDQFCEGNWDLNSLAIDFNPIHGDAYIDSGGVAYDSHTDFHDPSFSYFDFFIYSVNRTDIDEKGYAVAILSYLPDTTNGDSVGVCPTVLPMAQDDFVADIAIGQEICVAILNNDTFCPDEVDWASLAVTNSPAFGTATVSQLADSSVICYTANQSFAGEDHLTYEFCTTGGDCYNATVQFTGNSGNACATVIPFAVNDFVDSITSNQQVCIDVLANDTFCEEEMNWSSIKIVQQPLMGTVDLNMADSGVICYTAGQSFTDDDLFVYEFCTLNGDCYQANVTIAAATVSGCNVTTMAIDDQWDLTVAGDSICGNVLANDIYCANEFDMNSFEIVTQSNVGVVSTQSTGTICYLPSSNFVSIDSLSYRFCLLNGNCYEATLTIVD